MDTIKEKNIFISKLVFQKMYLKNVQINIENIDVPTPLKNEWDAKLVSFGKTQIGKPFGHLAQEMFAQLLSKVWKRSICLKTLFLDLRVREYFLLTKHDVTKKAKSVKKLFEKKSSLNITINVICA